MLLMNRLFLLAMAVLAAAMARADVFNLPTGQTSLQFVTVGNPGNAADPLTGLGAVGYTYQIGTYDVTLNQYVAFLNAVATPSDPYGLYASKMATSFPSVGISQSTNGSGGYTYSVIGDGNVPVFDVTWGDAARFCNWLQNGQPVAAEGNGTTETGAYTLTGTSNASYTGMTRNPGAVYCLPSLNEWYKAAYYNGAPRPIGSIRRRAIRLPSTHSWPAVRTTPTGAPAA